MDVSEQEFRELFRALSQFNEAGARDREVPVAWDAYLAQAGRVLGQERFELFR